MIKIESGYIILRDMIESDIEDYVRWFTVKRECEDWDAPWEKGIPAKKPNEKNGQNTTIP